MENSPLILLVEDDLSILEILKNALEGEGFKIMIAKDGQEGLKAAVENHPELILLDIIMPNMDGMEMLKHLRQNEWGQKVPVIIITNLSNPISETEAADLNVQDYIIKSDWQLEDIINKANTLLRPNAV